jgi:hypothetical protein
MTIVFAFFFLNGNMETEKGDSFYDNKFFVISLVCMVPGAIVGLIIKLKTKVTEVP